MKFNHPKNFLKLLSISLLFYANTVSSQPKDYYMLKALVVPVHTQSNQVFTSVGFDGGFNLNLSYSLKRKVYVYGSFNANPLSHQRKETVGGRYKIFKNDYAATLGFGRFEHSKHTFFNSYEYSGGLSVTRIDSYWRYVSETDENKDVFTQAFYQSAFMQVDGTKIMGNIHLGAGARIAYSRFGELKYYTRSKANVTSNSKPFSMVTLEPALSFSYLIATFRGNFQLGVSIPLYAQEVLMESTAGLDEETAYGDFYFFWRISIQRLKIRG